MIDELVEAIKSQRAILFVGAGVSQNLGLPGFGGLIDEAARQLGFDPEVFATHGDYLALAEFYALEKGAIGPLRTWMDKAWHNGVDLKSSEIHKLIVELNFPIIYTTNYDRWLELAFDLYNRSYIKIANVGDLANVRQGIPQIIKFHGDFDDDTSIVLTESSYFNRLDFESPLDIKLRSDLLGRSVLFIGYSLADINIRYMLYRLSRQYDAFPDARPQSFIFLTRPNPVQERILSQRSIRAIVSNADDPGIGLRDFLKNLSNKAFGTV